MCTPGWECWGPSCSSTCCLWWSLGTQEGFLLFILQIGREKTEAQGRVGTNKRRKSMWSSLWRLQSSSGDEEPAFSPLPPRLQQAPRWELQEQHLTQSEKEHSNSRRDCLDGQ